MNKTQEALKLAQDLTEFAERFEDGDWSEAINVTHQEIKLLKDAAQALAQQRPQNCGTGYCSCVECLFEQPAQQQEPVAIGRVRLDAGEVHVIPFCRDADESGLIDGQLVYTSPPASKPWVGLTDKEFQWIYDNGRTPAGMIEMAEAKLREKNA